MNRWMVWTVTLVIFLDYIQMQNLKTFKINNVNFLIIHVIIDFNGEHHKKIG
jgi:hypothetical protein